MGTFDNALFRCSSIGKIMSESRSSGGLTEKQEQTLSEYQTKAKLTDKQAEDMRKLLDKKNAPPKLGKTAMMTCIEMVGYIKYAIEPDDIQTIYTKKGLKVEDSSIQLYSQVRQFEFDLKKNERTFRNPFIIGTPDIVDERLGFIPDVKSSWSWETFSREWINQQEGDLNSDYYAQIQGYAELTNMDEGRIVYCLIDTPREIVEQELRSFAFKIGLRYEDAMFNPVWNEYAQKLETQRTFPLIKKENRIVEFIVPRDREFIEKVYERIHLCRTFMNRYFG